MKHFLRFLKAIGTHSIIAAALPAAMIVSAGNADYNVIPLPRSIELKPLEAPFILNGKVTVKAPKNLKNEADFIRQWLPAQGNDRVTGTVTLSTALESDNSEAYRITVDSLGISIDGASPAGVFYGLMTLRKSIPADTGAPIIFPAGVIKDAPRFSYRGAHLDVSRHFFNVDEVKQFIDMLALHNLNTFHWHLTDDQGWRIEIKKYPKLTQIGSYRPCTIIGRNGDEGFDSIPVSGYYTRKEIRDVIDYATSRHIQIIPEIDLPSHMMAALASYPELGCTGGPYEVLCKWWGYEDVLCPGKDFTMQFIDDVLSEVSELFPAPYIHIGGDECPKTRWKECPHCQARIKELGIVGNDSVSAETLLQGYVTSFAADVARRHGKSVIGWDEILDADIPGEAIVMSWRGIEGAEKGTARNHRVIQTPNDFLYFDYYQSRDVSSEPVAIGGLVTVDRVYSFEPYTQSMTPDQKALVMGPQANLWTEYIPTFSHVQYMELPRLAALSEVQWTKPEKKDWRSFKNRTPRLFALYDSLGYNYARHIMDVEVDYHTDYDNHCLIADVSAYPGDQVHYTLDGTTPTPQSPIYKTPLTLSSDCNINIASFAPDQTLRNMLSDTLRVSMSTFGRVSLANEPYGPFAFGGAEALTDGLSGSDNFRDGRWVGFLGKACDATIILPEPEQISAVSFNTCIVLAEGALDFSRAEIYGSADGDNFILLATVDNPEQDPAQPNGLSQHFIPINPTVLNAVRVVIYPAKRSGQWERILFVDDIKCHW